MSHSSLSVVAAAVFALLLGSPVWAQLPATVPSVEPEPQSPSPDLAPPLYAVLVSGAVTVTRDGGTLPLDVNAPVVDGDRVRTASGRVELGATPWGSLFLDERSAIDVVSPDRVRLVEGRLRIVANESVRTALQVHVAGATILPGDAGSYSVEVGGGARADEVTLVVKEGSAEFQADAGTLMVRAGERVTLRPGGAPQLTTATASARFDAFERWVDAQVQARQATTAPAAASDSLPSSLATYSGTLSQHGEWSDEADYGQVWYPNVAVDWQPYAEGRWDRVGRYGWFWIGVDPWAWPTHHYGRWGFRAGRWFWAPSDVWAPAWVHWAVGPGYVGWCALGRDNAPVSAFKEFGTGVSYYRGGRYSGNDRWRGWSLVPRHHLDSRQAVSRGAVDPRSLPHAVTTAFVTQHVAPPSAGRQVYAASRGDVPAGSGPATVLRRGSSSSTSPYERARPFMGRGSTDSGRGSGESDAPATTGGRALPRDVQRYHPSPRTPSDPAGAAAPREPRQDPRAPGARPVGGAGASHEGDSHRIRGTAPAGDAGRGFGAGPTGAQGESRGRGPGIPGAGAGRGGVNPVHSGAAPPPPPAPPSGGSRGDGAGRSRAPASRPPR